MMCELRLLSFSCDVKGGGVKSTLIFPKLVWKRPFMQLQEDNIQMLLYYYDSYT